MKARSEQAAATRARIVDAIVELHEQLGPRRTSIKAIAARAGVERLTVYRHFPDEAALLRACSSCWAERNPPPDPATWRETADPAMATPRALAALYGYFSKNRAMLTQVHHDLAEMPVLAEVSAPFHAYLENIADELARRWAPSGRREAVGAVLRHAVRFETWSLLHAEGWNDAQKIDRLLVWIRGVAEA